MKLALALAATIIAAPAVAKTWADQSCSVAFVSENDTFSIVRDGNEGVSCNIEAWPVGQAEAAMECSDGTSPTLVLASDDRIVVDGIEMHLVTDTGPICD